MDKVAINNDLLFIVKKKSFRELMILKQLKYNDKLKKRCMMNEFYNDERSLSPCETIIMKAIWDKGEDISISELSEILKTKYNKDYKRTTIVTFILNLTAKGFARQYRKGRYAYVHALKSEGDYKQKLLKEQKDFWYHGNVVGVVAALCTPGEITKQEIQMIREILDDLDDSDESN